MHFDLHPELFATTDAERDGNITSATPAAMRASVSPLPGWLLWGALFPHDLPVLPLHLQPNNVTISCCSVFNYRPRWAGRVACL